jgi:CubicO group peptidase (beta-lactamase class C family)
MTLTTSPPGTTALDDAALRERVDSLLGRRACVGLAFGMVRDGRLEFFTGHGVADIATGTPVTQDTVFRVASITKTFTAVAVMQLVERGLVELDAPANAYLRSYQLMGRHGWQPATVRHLLTHTGGLGEETGRFPRLAPDFGESVPAGRPLPPLAAYYHEHLRLDAEPGTRFRYGDHSFATLGQLVEDVSGRPFDEYLREHVFGPLGMTDTDVVRSERVRARLATGYRLTGAGPRPVTHREAITTGASSGYSTPRDMARYLAALLGGGANEHGRVLAPDTLATMFDAHYRNDPRLPGIGLAFFRADAGGRRAVEHQGILPGFDSQIVLAPDDGVGLMAFSNGTRQGSLWLPAELGGLLGELIGAPQRTIRADVPQRPDLWSELCGWYYLPGPLSDVRLRTFMGAGLEVFVRGGELRARFLTPIPALFRGLVLHPDDDADPRVFRVDLGGGAPGTTRMVFGTAEDGSPVLHLELMPLTLGKRSPATNPRRWAQGAAAAVGLSLAARRLVRRSVAAHGGERG